MASTIYGDISPRTAAYVVKDLLKRGMPYLCLEKFGQSKPLPSNATKTIKFRRYFLKHADVTSFTPASYFATSNFNPVSKQLSEGVTPEATQMDKQDIEATLVQYGDRSVLSDVILDTHEDPVLRENTEILGEQAAIILEKARFNVIKAGSNVIYGATADTVRTNVDDVIGIAKVRLATRTLKRQLAKQLTSMVKSTPSYGTEAIAPSFIAFAHPDMEYDIRALTGFVPSEKYGTTSPMENEVGKAGDVRFILSTIFEPWRGAGNSGASATVMCTTVSGSALADVYPVLIIAKDAFGIVPFKGSSAVVPMVVNPKPSDSDPMAQRGHVAWKAMQTTIILNDAWMVRIEVACTLDSGLT
jgi:N4-gp56 family major capsid protein